MAIRDILKLINNPAKKMLSHYELIIAGASEADIDAMVTDNYLSVEYWILHNEEPLYLESSDIRHRVMTGELINPETGTNHSGDVFFHYRVIKNIGV